MPLDPSKIRQRRESLKLSQVDAARAAGMPPPHWYRIESGKRPDPNLSTAEKVAKALGTTIAKLLA